MPLNWTTPNPIDSAYWAELRRALASRRISVISNYLSAKCAPLVIRPHASAEVGEVDALLDALRASVNSGVWKKADGETLQLRDVFEASNCSMTPSRGATPAADEVSAWIAAFAGALKLLRYRAGTATKAGGGWGGVGYRYVHFVLGGTTIADAVSLAASSDFYASPPTDKCILAGLDTGTRRVLRTQPPESLYLPGSPYGVETYSAAGEIRAVAPCPWAVPASLKFSMASPTIEFSTDVSTFDAWGTPYTEGANVIASPDRVWHVLTDSLASPTGPSENGTIANQGYELIGWEISDVLFDYGDAITWTMSERETGG